MRRYAPSACKYAKGKLKPVLAYELRLGGCYYFERKLMTAWEFLTGWPPFLPSVEGKQPMASKSEMRRWLERKSMHVNGVAAAMDTVITDCDSVVLHPNGKRRTTLQ